MSLRPSERTEVRRNRYKVAVDADDGPRRREDNIIEIHKSKREESLQKKRREGMPSQNSILSLQSSVIEKKGMAETSVLSPEGPSASDDEIRDLEVSRAQNNKKRLRKDSDAGKKRGVCYLSRVPPHMDPTRLRQILSQYGDIHRIYLVPEITLETLVEVTVPLSPMRKLIQL